MFFIKRIFKEKTETDIPAESRIGRKKSKKNNLGQGEDVDLSDSRCGKKALEKLRKKNENKKPWSKRRIVLLTCLAVLIAALAGVSLYIYDIWANPMDQFDTVANQYSDIEAPATPSATEAGEPSQTLPATPTPTDDPYESLISQADLSILNKTVNIMLIGVDYAQERETWNGKHAYHSDVMIVLSINTITNEVNLISLPRDTYAKIPGVDGIYKLNASIDCGGGWPKEEGFEKVCEAASWMLGGIPVQYYYAVDMSAVKSLVDSVGGVDFDMDIAFKLQDRSYKAGIQHMDGQAVLDYLRVRKKLGSESGDLNRINRQKKMLVAIFEKVKNSGMLSNLPKMLDAFKGNLYTNTTLGQTAGLAAFFYKLDSDKIELHSMDGGYHSIFNWSFVITDQEKRVKLIKDIYGVDVPVYKEYTYAYASHQWEKMQSKVIASKSKSILNKVKKILGEEPKPTVEPTTGPTTEPTTEPTVEPTTEPTVEPTTEPTTEPTAKPTTEPTIEPTTAPPPDTSEMSAHFYDVTHSNGNMSFGAATILAGYRKYDEKAWDLYREAESTYKKLLKSSSTSELHSANTEMKADIERLCSLFSIGKPSWRVNYESSSNEIYVDFR